ncbi:MAG: hypothetical protein J0L99_09840 [Chitinophagales bacterium]|nr:hypothetical protein [Chitinophagales bacterium]
MKKIHFFRLALYFFVFITSPCDIFTQTNSKYPIEISDINLPSEMDEPQILLSAIVKDEDFYVILLRIENSAEFRKEMIIRPFTQENFIYTLRKGRTLLINQYQSQKAQNRLDLNSQSKRTPVQNSVRDSIDAPFTQYETGLFYQFKGSEIATPIGFGRPVAGKLYFSPEVIVKKKLNSFDNEVANFNTDSKIKKEWESYLSKSNQKHSKKISKHIYKSIKEKVELEKSRKDDGLFEQIHEQVLIQMQNSINTSVSINEKIQELDFRFRELMERAKRDTSFLPQNLKDRYLKEMESTYKNRGCPLWSCLDNKFDERAQNDPELKELKSYFFDYKIPRSNWGSDLYRFVFTARTEWARINEFSSSEKKLDSLYSSLIPALSMKTSFKFNVEYVEIEFNEGFIENILVVGNVKTLNLERFYNNNDLIKLIMTKDVSNNLDELGYFSKRIKFESKYPFGFSRKSDYESLSKIKITSNGKNDEDRYMLELGDLLSIYLPKHEVGRRDFSPENKVIQYYPTTEGKDFVTLYKEETSKIFEARVYSDFVGLDAKAANGLLQTEISKRLNLNTQRPILNHGNFLRGFGALAWLEPIITLSKIEQNNRNLLLSQIVPNDTFGRTRNYATTLDIRRHESLSVGARMNILSYDIPSIKSTLSGNSTFYYGRTPTQTDTIESGINTLTFSPEVNCDVRADERWGLSFSYRWNYMKTLSRDVVQISDLLDPNNQLVKGIKNKQYNTAQFQVFFQPTEDNRGRLFFRYRYHWQYGDQNLGFHQAQVGYSFYLLGRNKGADK